MKHSILEEALDKNNMKSYFNDIIFERDNKEKYLKRIHDLSIFDLERLVDSVIAKYNSVDYINKEHRLGYFPRTPLYWLFLDYIVKYGQDLHEIDVKIDIDNDCPFPNVTYIFDRYRIKCMQGNGSSIDVVKL